MKSISNLFKYPGQVMAMVLIFSSLLVFGQTLHGQANPVKLVYNIQKDKNIRYESKTAVNQTMDINGQTMNVLVDSYLGFKVRMLEKVSENLKYNITLDSLKMSIDAAMQGSSNIRVGELEGKSFNMLISPRGKVVDLSEAEKIRFNIESQGSSNLAESFRDIFPVLPDKAVKPGDTWSSVDTVSSQSSAATTSQILESNYRFEGVEKLNGTDCAKIVSTVKGTAATNAQSMGMDIFYSGPVEGQVTMYFAIKEGYYVKQIVSTKMNGTIEISGAENMSFPIYVDTKSTTEAK